MYSEEAFFKAEPRRSYLGSVYHKRTGGWINVQGGPSRCWDGHSSGVQGICCLEPPLVLAAAAAAKAILMMRSSTTTATIRLHMQKPRAFIILSTLYILFTRPTSYITGWLHQFSTCSILKSLQNFFQQLAIDSGVGTCTFFSTPAILS